MARIGDLLAEGTTRSFELFPPKTDEAERALDKAVAELAELRPSFMSVTYGALGSTRARTREVVLRVNRDYPFAAMPHLTCMGHTTADVSELLDDYAAGGVENILALGGDPPADGPAEGDFEHAIELVELVRAHPAGFGVGVAAHPEVHPRSPDRASDRRHLALKLRHADFGITQFFFTAEHYVRMVNELADLDCHTPVIPGVMPIINVAGLRRMAAMNGTDIPAPLADRLDAAEGDAAEVARIGVDVAASLGHELLEAGAPGLHLYALNRSDSGRAVFERLGWTA